MNLMFKLLAGLVKSLILLHGIAMLVGGGICSLSIIPAAIIEPRAALPMLIIALPVTALGYALVRSFFPNKYNKPMNLKNFLEKIQNQQAISFNETIAFIDENYDYQPTEFSNGLGEDKLISPAGVNQGSCKIFAFAQLHNLTPEQTLNLFGDYYHVDVLQNPDATDHQNIRNFMKYGWEGISFQNQPLLEKKL